MNKFLLAAACGVIIASAMPAAATVTITNSVKLFDRSGASLFQQSGPANIVTDDYEAAGFVDPVTGPSIDAYVSQTNTVFRAQAKSLLQYNFYIGCTAGQSCSVTPDHPLAIPVLVDYSLFAHPGWDFSDTSASIDITDGFGDSYHRGLACSSDSDPCDDISATGRLDFVVSYIDGDGKLHSSTQGSVLLQAQAHGNSENNGRDFSGEAGVDPTLYIDPQFLVGHPGYTLTTDTVLLGDTAGVPEPASWALMLLGFGGLGVALRTHHRARGTTPPTAQPTACFRRMAQAWKKLVGVIVAVVGLLAISAPAVAAITLTYTGNAFNSIGSTAAGSGITGYVVLIDFDTSVGRQFIASDLIDWSISNGSYTLSQADGNALTRFNMQIADGGEVKTWSFDAQDTAGDTWTKFSRTDSAFLDVSVIKDNSYSGESQNTGPSGGWSVPNAVPEPATWSMMLLGLALIGGVMRRNRGDISFA